MEDQKVYIDIEARDFSKQYPKGHHYRILDVRRDEEVEQGMIPDAVHIPLDELEQRAGELNPDEDILIVCRSGRRSVFAAYLLNELGFAKLYNLKGGMLEWEGETVEKGKRVHE
ncbi:rhodanese-like domain-containing protein [Microaerobacter geothermalis]|uniref:rhodanese-like domain-containing protein n=1 Tax=Microaerobacter geothermalis TaxID=674972 RepID=UPI001F3A8C83|nr:rhodanese-like domain-containing protein [Microaerobacter geothermalis]MCF6092499.1 rhodanese-like domain-containing protein [Microaerobacter geothermalis]